MSAEAAWTYDSPHKDEVTLERFPRVDWLALWSTPAGDVDWIAEPVIEAGRLCALVGSAKAGKSLLALEIAAAVATGGHVLGHRVRRRRVVYIDFENTATDLRGRLEDLGYGPTDLDWLVYLSFPPLASLDAATGGGELVEVAETHAAALVVIDTTQRVVTGPENDSDTWRALYRHSLAPLKARGIAVLRLDHLGKDATRGARGSSAKSDDVDAVWTLTKSGEDRVTLRRTHGRQADGVELLQLYRQASPLRHVLEDHALDSLADGAVQLLDSLDLPNAAGRPAARAALAAAGQRVGNAVLQRAIAHRKARETDRGQLSGLTERPAQDELTDRLTGATSPNGETDRGHRPVSPVSGTRSVGPELTTSPSLQGGGQSGTTPDPCPHGMPSGDQSDDCVGGLLSCAQCRAAVPDDRPDDSRVAGRAHQPPGG